MQTTVINGVEFVRIKSEKRAEGYVVLARREFDPATHTLWVEPSVAPATFVISGDVTDAGDEPPVVEDAPVDADPRPKRKR